MCVTEHVCGNGNADRQRETRQTSADTEWNEADRKEVDRDIFLCCSLRPSPEFWTGVICFQSFAYKVTMDVSKTPV